eukprot:CAMPEP_0194270220 /NCGR_PEP_ID=MMETSP0169-20130528/4254_1 /TAXON_ID=218684 /ORGANISM="Corethron pennatum, Strain L29A3" /LENGTH=225 /DNA_ID=CAMNT_0039012185 /DNA_START=20 /DNA_END=697 /DNA_ORIENTATION=-
MGKNKRRDDEYDDSLERDYMRKKEKLLEPEDDNAPPQNEAPTSTPTDSADPDDPEQIERRRRKKRLKKQRQQEKKTAAAEAARKEAQLRKEAEKERRKAAADRKKRREQERNSPAEFTAAPGRSGVQYADLVVGTGPVVQQRKRVVVGYTLRAKTRTGKIIDSGKKFSFRLGKGEVISGWDIGLEGMRQGGTRHLTVPPGAGYGKKDIGGGAGALLYFEVKLLSC